MRHNHGQTGSTQQLRAERQSAKPRQELSLSAEYHPVYKQPVLENVLFALGFSCKLYVVVLQVSRLPGISGETALYYSSHQVLTYTQRRHTSRGRGSSNFHLSPCSLGLKDNSTGLAWLPGHVDAQNRLKPHQPVSYLALDPDRENGRCTPICNAIHLWGRGASMSYTEQLCACCQSHRKVARAGIWISVYLAIAQNSKRLKFDLHMMEKSIFLPLQRPLGISRSPGQGQLLQAHKWKRPQKKQQQPRVNECPAFYKQLIDLCKRERSGGWQAFENSPKEWPRSDEELPPLQEGKSHGSALRLQQVPRSTPAGSRDVAPACSPATSLPPGGSTASGCKVPARAPVALKGGLAEHFVPFPGGF
ncbi:hypothetical protein Anapl_03174 [Anas platyrhynchos]|uniref:Uncharacterized protein n=1 Tax=Anas platyrhynchos TaxID=8839 RepID=R0M1T9_ANAPL|nr:hypothetical protein Anapl_03174 [Anas platyrhynchos]